MNAEEKKKWIELRKEGKVTYILNQGGLLGILFATIPFIFPIIIEIVQGTFSIAKLNTSRIIITFLIAITIGFLLGCLYGWLSWNHNEADYSEVD